MLYPPLNPMPPVPWGYWHPGAFGNVRTHDIHTGVDLYAPVGCPVHAMESGKVIKIDWFTGKEIGMPWWESTRAIYIEGYTGVFNYGEVQEREHLKVGDTVNKGDYIGHVIQVLKKYKGRPQSMLHVELYHHGHTDDWGSWEIDKKKPEHLLDPTSHLLAMSKPCMEDPYKNTSLFYKWKADND